MQLDDNGMESEFGFHGWYQAYQGGGDTSSPAVAVSEDASGEYLRSDTPLAFLISRKHKQLTTFPPLSS